MSAKDTIYKIAKGVGDTNIGQKAKKTGKFINKHILEDVPERNKYDSLLYQVFPKRIKQKYTVGAVLGVSAIASANAIDNMQYRNDLGEIESGGLSHMTSQAISPTVEQLQSGEYNPENIMYGRGLRDSGATGDIIFALHNMR